jgi:hypothetical protein
MGIHRIYRATSPYPGSAVKGFDTAQTADVLYVTHLDYAPRKLVRYGHTDWRWSEILFGPSIVPPVGHSVAATIPNVTGYVAKTYKYIVTAIKDSFPTQESRASTVVQVDNDLTLSGNYNTVTVPAPAGDVSRHVIYKEQAGIYGYVGATEGTTFKDQNIQPILSETAPVGENPFDTFGNYPAACTFGQQRLLLGATRNVINGIWGSRSADYENMDRSRPARADDSLSFALVGERVNALTHLLWSQDLQAFTSDGIWSVSGGGEHNVITPSDINPKRNMGRGARRVKPIPVDSVIFFVPSKSYSIRAMGFSFEIEGYKSNNIALFSPHLFADHQIIKMAYQEEPFSILWAVRDDGILLAFTWEEEQQVWGWTPVETEGVVEDVEIISEAGFDRVYILVRRTIAGVSRLFIERLAMPHGGDITTACHLDCAITQVFDPPTDVITGLHHLEGETVSATYDGYVAHDLVVAGGEITLPVAATFVSVGLRYSGRIETLPSALTSTQGSLHVNMQQVSDVIVRTIDTRGIEIGASGVDFLEQVEPKDGQNVNELMNVEAIDYRIVPPGDWKETSTIIIEQNEPLPAHIVAIFFGMEVSST